MEGPTTLGSISQGDNRILCGRARSAEVMGLTVQGSEGSHVLEVHTDADWVGDPKSRRSASCSVVAINSVLLASSSRTQKVIALSSGESEYNAAVSGAVDALLIRDAVEFVFHETVAIHLLLDSSAARGIAARQGVGRLRHISANYTVFATTRGYGPDSHPCCFRKGHCS